MGAPMAALKQFTMNDPKFLIRDVEFWASSLDAFLQFYKEAKEINTPEDRAAKAIACARLAGLGVAMNEHFSAAVESLINVHLPDNPDLEAAEAAGMSVYDNSLTHTERQEAYATANMS